MLGHIAAKERVSVNILPDDDHKEPKCVVKYYMKFIHELW
jgi:hypothetical protein